MNPGKYGETIYITHREMYAIDIKSLKWVKYEATGHNMKGEFKNVF